MPPLLIYRRGDQHLKNKQGLSRCIGGTVTAGRDGKPPSKCSRRPVPSTKFLTVVTYRPVPPIKSLPWIITVPSRRDTEPLPSRTAVTPKNYRPVSPIKSLLRNYGLRRTQRASSPAAALLRDTFIRGRLFPSIPTVNHEKKNQIKSSCTQI